MEAERKYSKMNFKWDAFSAYLWDFQTPQYQNFVF